MLKKNPIVIANKKVYINETPVKRYVWSLLPETAEIRLQVDIEYSF